MAFLAGQESERVAAFLRIELIIPTLSTFPFLFPEHIMFYILSDTKRFLEN